MISFNKTNYCVLQQKSKITIYSIFLLPKQGKFSTRSDTWSFAVTLWEILSFAREQPFVTLSDDDVIDNFGHYYRGDGKEVCLPMPPMCNKEIFDLMRECWNRDELQRPSFREIHMFLQRKNMGYDPKEERQGNIHPQM